MIKNTEVKKCDEKIKNTEQTPVKINIRHKHPQIETHLTRII